jgi:hypothetical protein
MVKQLIATEKKIQRLTAERSSLLAQIPDLKAKKDIEGIKSAQRSANALDVAIDRLKQYWHSIKLVGDTMAQLMVDIDLIKQFALVQATGYVSGKEGLRDELKTEIPFRLLFEYPSIDVFTEELSKRLSEHDRGRVMGLVE